MHETIPFLTITQVRFKYTGVEKMVANNISTWRLGDRLSSSKLHGLVNECIRGGVFPT
jgi:hypothetical protein